MRANPQLAHQDTMAFFFSGRPVWSPVVSLQSLSIRSTHGAFRTESSSFAEYELVVGQLGTNTVYTLPACSYLLVLRGHK